MQSDNTFVKNLLGESRRRMVGSLMSYMEANVYPKLTKVEQQDLRAKVLASVGAYADTCLDILKASVDDGVVPNELWLEVLYEIRDAVTSWDDD